ncbi:MAG: hypothetical protein II192_04355, partial [Clostridia bacterium]|nr:hypothetical protein [Clostridia bacterium]
MLREFSSTGRDLFGGDADAEVRRQRNTVRTVVLVQGDLLQNERSETAGLSARVIRGGVAGFASVADVSEESVKAVLDEAHKNALFLDGQVALGKPRLPAAPRGSFRMAREPGDPEQKKYVEFAREVDAYIVKNCPKLVSRRLRFRADCMEKVLTVSGGTDAHTYLPRCYLYLFFTANTPDGVPVDLYSVVGGYGSFDTLFRDPEAIFPEVDLLYGKLLAKTEGIRPEAYEIWRQLKEESYHGSLAVNTYAGGTANTERGFLTGARSSIDPRGPYPSYVWYLRDQGYSCFGNHNYYSYYYNRLNINAYLGFEDYRYYQDYFEQVYGEPTSFEDSDKEFFAEILRQYRQREQSGQPLFSFNVTLQGHFPYRTDSAFYEGLLEPGSYSEELQYALDNY